MTVIIPTYNYARVLPYCIRSVLRQTFTDFELLVIGDHCTDESKSVVTGIGDPRIRWINLDQNVGHQSGPNNEGLRQARGELVAYLGHDDLWLPNHLALMVRNIDAGADLSYGLTELVCPDGRPPIFVPQEMDYQPGIWIPPTAVVHRKEPAIRLGGWKHFCDLADKDPETDLWQRMHEAGCRNRLVRMLTAVKFSAAMRKDVYATQPCHEQELWSTRIETDPDFVSIELARLLVPSPIDATSFRQSLSRFATDTLTRVRKRLWRFGLHAPPPTTKSRASYNQRLKFKGVKRPG